MRRRINGKLLVGGLVAIVLVIIIAFSLVGKSPAPEVINNPTPTASPTVPVKDTNDTATVGPDFSALIAAGVSARQIDSLQYAIYQFAQPAGISVKNTTVQAESVQHTVSEDGIGTYTFVLKFDESKSYKATMQASGLYTIRLYLSNTDGKQVYDSKAVDASKLN